jgi:O-antigen/teichoic acid export membrane protein
MMVLAPLWPAYGEAVRRKDLGWVRRHVALSLTLGFVLVLGFGTLMLLRGDWIVRIWTHGQPVVISKSLVLAFTAMFVARAWVDCRAAVLNSAEVLKPQVWFFVIHAVLNLAFAIPMAKLFGVEGVAWCAPATSLVTSFWAYPWMLRKYVYHRRSH